MSCIFCDIAEKKRPSTPVYEDETIFAFRDVNPQAPTHILLIPRKHVVTLNDLTPEDAELVGHLVLTARSLAEEEGCLVFEVLQPQGEDRIVLYEIYRDRAAFDLHVASAHFRRFDEATSPLVTSKAVTICERLGPPPVPSAHPERVRTA